MRSTPHVSVVIDSDDLDRGRTGVMTASNGRPIASVDLCDITIQGSTGDDGREVTGHALAELLHGLALAVKDQQQAWDDEHPYEVGQRAARAAGAESAGVTWSACIIAELVLGDRIRWNTRSDWETIVSVTGEPGGRHVTVATDVDTYTDCRGSHAIQVRTDGRWQLLDAAAATEPPVRRPVLPGQSEADHYVAPPVCVHCGDQLAESAAGDTWVHRGAGEFCTEDIHDARRATEMLDDTTEVAV